MRFDLHVHTTYSRCSTLDVEAAIKHGARIGLGGIAITDHNTTAGIARARAAAKRFGLILVPGTEITYAPSILEYFLAGKHMVALGIEETPQKWLGALETIDFVHDRGGLAVLAHPARFLLHPGCLCDLRKKQNELAKIDAIEALHEGRFFGNAIRVAKLLKIPVVAGSDAHMAMQLGTCYTELKHCESVDDVLKEIKRGRTEVHTGQLRNSIAALAGHVNKTTRAIFG